MSHWTVFEFTLPSNHSIESVRKTIHKHGGYEFTSRSDIRAAGVEVWSCSISEYLDDLIDLLNLLRSKYSINPVITHAPYFGGLRKA